MTESIQSSQQWLEKLLTLMGFTAQIQVKSKEEASVSSDWLIIDHNKLTSEEIETLIGPEGKTLDAIQYLANSQLNLEVDDAEGSSLTVELNNYRLERNSKLQSLAEASAQEVRDTGKEVATPPLSAADRKQIHHLLQDVEDVVTQSQGEEPERYVVVQPQN